MSINWLKRRKKAQKSAIHSDVLGSYTGMPLKGNEPCEDEKPVQDADDL